MKADDLWEKYHLKITVDSWEVIEKCDFIAALKEYGEHFKSEAVKVCDKKDCAHLCGVGKEFAAAIKKMPLP